MRVVKARPPPLEASLFLWMGATWSSGRYFLPGGRCARPTDSSWLRLRSTSQWPSFRSRCLTLCRRHSAGRPSCGPIRHPPVSPRSRWPSPTRFSGTRLFALDAYLRRFIPRVCSAGAIVRISSRHGSPCVVGIGDQLALVAGVAIVALFAPTIIDSTKLVVEAWFYPSLGLARAGLLTDGVASPSSIACAFAARSRGCVPTRWVALLVRANVIALDGPAWTVLGWDGDVPTGYTRPDWPVALSSLADDVPGTNVLHLDCSPNLFAAVCLGPRLDGTPHGGLDLETIRLLGRNLMSSIEAALFAGTDAGRE